MGDSRCIEEFDVGWERGDKRVVVQAFRFFIRMGFLPAAFRPGRDRAKCVEDGLSGSTLQQQGPQQPQRPQSRRQTIVSYDPNDKLAIFRHMVGIHSTREFATAHDRPDLTHNNLHFDGRAAPNLGIYNRVCHREQEAKRGYKLSSLLINGCLGVQVIVAAALTAMGAANSNHVSITAFGAINTVIAGILTYLKGSGLPNRIRYYENEWKKIREYIEQRERDFSRPDCQLDVYEVVRVIENMYEDVRADVQTNTPDNYISVSDIRNRQSVTNPQAPKLGELTSAHATKFQEIELKYGHKIAEFLENLAHKEEERLKSIEKGLERQADVGRSKIIDMGSHFEKDYEAGRARLVDTGRDFEKGVEEKGVRVVELARDAERELERHRSNVSRIGRAVDNEIHSVSPRTKEEQ
ncbi:hypothetical protein CC78DRAFT_530556 [Lojkania enalia]|uniref:SMODS and SLOG-associating 2TM effector domain-containing protein n=1 Tax=Lojkania enalia TaxID=147567 RepID=A0A9P4N6Q0_9PLEO|nr:hypothetical protein CC78DRAFT_530556 [Didymosphaeria enalia]